MQMDGEEDVMQSSAHRRSKSVPSIGSGSLQLDDTGFQAARARSGTDSGQRLVHLNRSKARLSSGGLLRSQSKKKRAKYGDDKSRSNDFDIDDKSSRENLTESNQLSIDKKDEEFVVKRKYGTISVVNNLIESPNIEMHNQEDFHNNYECEQTAPRDVRIDVEDEQSNDTRIKFVDQNLEETIQLDNNFPGIQGELYYKSYTKQETTLDSRRRSLPAKLSKYQTDLNIDYEGHESASLGSRVTRQENLRKFHSLPTELNKVNLLKDTQTTACTGQLDENQPVNNLNQNMELLHRGHELTYENLEDNVFAGTEHPRNVLFENEQSHATKRKTMAQIIASHEKQLDQLAASHRVSRCQDDKPVNPHRKHKLKRQRRTKSLPSLLVLEEIPEVKEEEFYLNHSLEGIARLHVNRAFCELLRKIRIKQARKTRKEVRRTHSLSTIQERLYEENEKNEKLGTVFHDHVVEDRTTHDFHTFNIAKYEVPADENTQVCKSWNLENNAEINEKDKSSDKNNKCAKENNEYKHDNNEEKGKEHEERHGTKTEVFHEKATKQDVCEISGQKSYEHSKSNEELHKETESPQSFREELVKTTQPELDCVNYEKLLENETDEINESSALQQVNEKKKKKKKRKKKRKGKDNRTPQFEQPLNDQGQLKPTLEHETASLEAVIEGDREQKYSGVENLEKSEPLLKIDQETFNQEIFLEVDDGQLNPPLDYGHRQLNPPAPLTNDRQRHSLSYIDEHQPIEDNQEQPETSHEVDQEQLMSLPEDDQKQLEPSIEDNQEQPEPSHEVDQEQLMSSHEDYQKKLEPSKEDNQEQPELSHDVDQEQLMLSLEGDQEQLEPLLKEPETSHEIDQIQVVPSHEDGHGEPDPPLEIDQKQTETYSEYDEASINNNQEKCAVLQKDQGDQVKAESSLVAEQQHKDDKRPLALPHVDDQQLEPSTNNHHAKTKLSFDDAQRQSESPPEDDETNSGNLFQVDQKDGRPTLDECEQPGTPLEDSQGKLEPFLRDNWERCDPSYPQVASYNYPNELDHEKTQLEQSLKDEEYGFRIHDEIVAYEEGAPSEIPDILLCEVDVNKEKVDLDTIDEEKDEPGDFQCSILEQVEATDYTSLDSTLSQRPKVLPLMAIVPEVSEESSTFQGTGTSPWEKAQSEEEGSPTRKKSWPLENKASQKRVTWSVDLIEAKSPDSPMFPELEFANAITTDHVIKEEITEQVKEFDDIISDVVNSYLEPNYMTSKSAIHRAIAQGSVKALEDLIEEGVDVNANDEHGWPPLHVAMLQNNVDCAEILLNAGADLKQYTDRLVQEYHSIRNDTIRSIINS